jgi:hypothetical protein
MSTAPLHADVVPSEKERWSARILVREMWASLAIAVMWLTVLFDALFGPDFVTSGVTTSTRIPSALFLALFAYLGTRVVARYGLARRGDAD